MKKIISFMLTIVMVLSIITMVSIEAAAIGNYGVNLDSACYSSSNPFRNYWGQCTWYAWGRALEKTGVALPYRGNAKTWTSNAVSAPRANSVAVWTSGTYGHVAFVEAYDGTNLYITEANRVSGQYTEGVINLSTRRFTYTCGATGSYILSSLPNGYTYCGSTDTTPPSVDSYRACEFRDGLFTIDAHVTDASGIRSVNYAVWTINNGQDDLVWYKGNHTDGNNHFWTWVAFSEHKNERGTYIMDIYATDNAGNETSKRISYTFPDKAPVVSNIQVTDVSSKGYTVKCTVKSVSEMGVSRVQFPTWTANNGQDDLASEWWTNTKVRGTISGNTVTFRVNASEHKNEKGTYITHIYAYDKIGNADSVGVSVNVHDHSWNSGTTTKAATCTSTGTKKYTCTVCGQTKTETISKLTHKYKKQVISPTATTLGYTAEKCSHCGNEKNITSYTAPTGKVGGLKLKSRNDSSITVTWNKVSGISGYQIQTCTKDGKKWSTCATLGSGTNTYTFKKLASGNNYKFRCRFFIKGPDGKTYYSPWSGTLNSPTLPKGTTLSKLTAAKKAFTAQWKKQSGVTGYQVQYSTSSKFTNAKFITVKNVKTLKATAKNLSAKKTYYVRVRTYKTINKVNYCSAWSKTYKVKTK